MFGLDCWNISLLTFTGSSTISKEELRAFYTMFLGIDFRVVNETIDVIYNAMTDVSLHKFYTKFQNR
jgi:hypothetical protein